MTTTNVTVAGTGQVSRDVFAIHSRVEAHARLDPGAVAVVSVEGEQLTYGELAAWSGEIADRLRAAGVGTEDRVAVTAPRSPVAVAAFLGVLRAGAAYVPIDPDFPVDRQRFMVEDAAVRAVLAPDGETPPFAEGLPVVPAGTGPRTAYDPGAAFDPGAGERVAGSPGAGAAAHAAYVIYTSGSTGVPKGVVVDHGSVLALVEDEERIAVRPGQSVAQYAPTAFDASTFEIWGALCRGARVDILPGGPVSVADLAAVLAKRRPDWLFLTTGLFHVVADHAPEVFSSVGCLITGGDVLSPQHVRAAARVPGVRVLAAYGPTETTVFASLHAVDPDAETDRVPIGSPLAGRSLYVLDDELRELPAGEPGELYIGGAGVARSYLGRARLTAAHFVPDPFATEPSARMYRTGDLACRTADGEFAFLGRRDRQVKIRGFRIELGEIEAVLSARDEVAGAAVVAHDDGAGGKRLAAYAVPAGEAHLTASQLRAWLRTKLPAHMVPGTFVVLPEMPRDPNGKPDRDALPYPWASRDQLGELPEYVAPASEQQALVAEVWSEVLGLDRVGLHDNFYELGGDSILSVDTIQRLRVLGIECSAGDFFRHQTVDELARVTSDRRTGAA